MREQTDGMLDHTNESGEPQSEEEIERQLARAEADEAQAWRELVEARQVLAHKTALWSAAETLKYELRERLRNTGENE